MSETDDSFYDKIGITTRWFYERGTKNRRAKGSGD
jgi:hypothetical protein